MDRWLKFFSERFPLVNSVALVTGISLSGISLSGRPFHFLPFILSFTGIVFIFALIYLMDDLKNLEKDRLARSNRPLPKGLITKPEAIFVIEIMEMILFAYSLLLWILLNVYAALAYMIVVAYFWLMSKDFGIREWLNKHPLVHGCVNQLIIVPIAIFAVCVMHPETIFFSDLWSFAMMLFGAFFCYEICRKLNPRTHPVLSTYIHFYGYHFIYNVATIALAISAMGAISLGLAYLLIPCEVVVLAALSAVYFQKSLFRLPQILASLSLMLHSWAIVIYQALYQV